MELIRPEIGVLFWMIIVFGLVLLILRVFAWKPILNALKDREKTIQQRLDVAKKAKKELAEIEFGNERIIALAKTERANMLKEAKNTKNKIIKDAKKQAQKETDKIMRDTHLRLEQQKKEKMEEIKNQIASLSVDVAEKILKEKLSKDKSQKDYIKNLVDDIEIN